MITVKVTDDAKQCKGIVKIDECEENRYHITMDLDIPDELKEKDEDLGIFGWILDAVVRLFGKEEDEVHRNTERLDDTSNGQGTDGQKG